MAVVPKVKTVRGVLNAHNSEGLRTLADLRILPCPDKVVVGESNNQADIAHNPSEKVDKRLDSEPNDNGLQCVLADHN